MSYFIAENGKVYSTTSNTNKDKPRLSTEPFGIVNCFESKIEATYARDNIEDYHPRIFYGK